MGNRDDGRNHGRDVSASKTVERENRERLQRDLMEFSAEGVIRIFGQAIHPVVVK